MSPTEHESAFVDAFVIRKRRDRYRSQLAPEDRFDSTFVSVSDVDETFADAMFGLLVCYIPGKLAAYKDEAPANVVWLSRG